MKVSDYIVDFLIKAGIKHVFLLPGGGAMHLNDSLGKRRKEIEFVGMLHEQAVSIAAEAYAKVTNLCGAAMVTSGPAGTNTVTGVAGAWLDSMPCIFFSGQVKRGDLKKEALVRQLGSQEIDIVEIVKSITKYAFLVTEPETIRLHIEKAFYLAKHGRPGPVWLDLPLDVQAAQIDPKSLKGYIPDENSGKTSDLKGTTSLLIKMIKSSKRPVVIAGNGVRISGGIDIFRRFIDSIKAPVLTTWLGMDLIPDSHPLFAGRPGAIAPRWANFALQNSDLMISIGARLDMTFTGYAHEKLARGAKKVMVDIDISEINKMRTPIHLPITADAKDFCSEFLHQWEKVSPPDFSDWLSIIQNWKTKYPVVQKSHRSLQDKVSVYYFSEVLSRELSEGDLVVSGSSGTAVELFLLAFSAKERQRVFHTRGLGAMGFGIPAAIGACLAKNRQRTICIDGDGGFQMNIQELATVARLNLPIKFFVINNNGYASIRSSQISYFQQLVSADETSGLRLPDLQKVAGAYGVPSIRVNNQINLPEIIRESLQKPGPNVCEIMALPDEQRAPRISSYARPDGSMVSRPLEDLWPFLDRKEFLENMLIQPLEE